MAARRFDARAGAALSAPAVCAIAGAGFDTFPELSGLTISLDSTQAVIDRERSNRTLVRGWLYGICALVAAMVVVGGATRLTDSGLSITEWELLIGIVPPLSEADWQIAFDKYKQLPEYRLVNEGMSLAQFQFIYWWEWAHRLLGRIIGVAFIVPLVWFWVAGRIEPKLKLRLLLLLAMGALQGAVGWWMVRSGLVDRVDVSQYRLAVHLTLAAVIFAYALWIARGLAVHSDERADRVLHGLAPTMVVVTGLQIFAGALVAGLDAGLAFNTWPRMDGALWPDGLLVQEPAWRNFFENPKTVQFVHRLIAYGLVLLVLVNWVSSRSRSNGETHRRRGLVLLALVLVQAVLGVVTLIWQVPIGWALAHQATAFALLGFAVAHWRALRGSYPAVTGLRVAG